MTERREYEMTEEQLAVIRDASKPVPYLVVGGMPPGSPQENAHRAWQALGDEMGFDWQTAESAPGRGERFFTAVPRES